MVPLVPDVRRVLEGSLPGSCARSRCGRPQVSSLAGIFRAAVFRAAVGLGRLAALRVGAFRVVFTRRAALRSAYFFAAFAAGRVAFLTALAVRRVVLARAFALPFGAVTRRRVGALRARAGVVFLAVLRALAVFLAALALPAALRAAVRGVLDLAMKASFQRASIDKLPLSIVSSIAYPNSVRRPVRRRSLTVSTEEPC